MNEIIKELIDRCTTHYNGGLGTEIEVFDKEKFAQLIVRECAQILDEDSYMIPELGGYAHDIRKHFGVKE
jgi:hypothetical protein